MKDYTIYATEEIAKKAMEKGFECEEGIRTKNFKPIAYLILESNIKIGDYIYYKLPTAEQICGWLREKKGISICAYRDEVVAFGSYHVTSRYKIQIILDNVEGYRKHSGLGVLETFDSYEQAILKGICIALNLLNNN